MTFEKTNKRIICVKMFHVKHFDFFVLQMALEWGWWGVKQLSFFSFVHTFYGKKLKCFT